TSATGWGGRAGPGAPTACRMPPSSSGTAACPCLRPSRFHSVRPCRHTTSRRAVTATSRRIAGDRRRQRDQRAVPPEPLEGVEGALLVVLDVDDDVEVVQQHPAALPLALAAYRLGVQGAPLLLDRRRDQERVGDRQLLGDVERDHVLGLLVVGGLRGRGQQLDGPLGCSHLFLNVEVALRYVLDDAVRYEVPGRLAAVDAFAALGRGDRQRRYFQECHAILRELIERERQGLRPRPGTTHEMRERERLLDVSPG